jgi:hypothetical protein
MTTLEILPHVGAGPIRLGMTRAEVQSVLASTPRRFRRGPESSRETDHFVARGVFAEYDEEGRCEAIELAAPAEPLFRGERLLGRPFAELLTWLRREESAVETDGAGLTCRSLGIGFYAPFAESEPQEPVEAVIVFREGYYD